MSTDEDDEEGGCGCLTHTISLIVMAIGIGFLIFMYLVWIKPSAPLAEASFERGPDGWLIIGDAQGDSNQPTHKTEGGNPGSYMEAVDDAVGGVWYWEAPEAFRGLISSAWSNRRTGRESTLEFDLRQSDVSAPFPDEDVLLSNGKIDLFTKHQSPPNTDWTSYRIPLSDASHWTNQATGESATQEELDQVMSNLKRLWIRGEFRTGPDKGGLDNVIVR